MLTSTPTARGSAPLDPVQADPLKSLTYADVIREHQALDIDFEKTMSVIRILFPECVDAAIGVWTELDGQTLEIRLSNSVFYSCLAYLDGHPEESLDSLVARASARYLEQAKQGMQNE
jgi:hypothetical protein